MNGGKRNAYRIFMGKPKGKSPLGRPWCMWADNMKKRAGLIWLRIGTGWELF
jgi:hypothetical protein